MRAVVLVGGEGTRLRPLTLSTPKQMLPVAGRPVIERVIENLAKHGVDEVVLSLGYKPDAFIAAYPDGRCGDVTAALRGRTDPARHWRCDSVRRRRGWYQRRDLPGSQRGRPDRHRHQVPWSISTANVEERARSRLHPVEDPSLFGVVPVDDGGRVEAFIEKPPPAKRPPT